MTLGSRVELTESHGSWAVSFARRVIESVVKTGNPPPKPEDVDGVFEIERGAFVTLRKNGRLRGCIGRPTPEQSAIKAIRAAAVEAATNDPRFPPVSESELSTVTVEVSILTPPKEVTPVDSEAITVGQDGLIVQRNDRSGLLLPQVPADQSWDAETFLTKTCKKAGLQGDCWQQPDTTVLQFRAQVFEETEPNGPIERVGLTEQQN
ncbi:AmmeMemoRadiSam system protein A [Halodesulfurarchaeum sp.]|uniref:AmmeMemoRadiSam system protein A n=1 Tax=Halodesulfurarchaeum sp. TaxID=1980530 RepID=UPI001BC1300C|nr:AmmeMemoRadiSam system protein A [Halodesulfurarchaeum sp.]